nr:PepSY-associated TM helix domain-containing protein [Pedobacter sp. MC2016-24]
MIYPYRWARNQNTFFFDERSGQLLRAKLYRDFNGADLVEATNYDLHTGRLFGLFGKTVAFLAALISASLPVTGLIIWLKKKRKR